MEPHGRQRFAERIDAFIQVIGLTLDQSTDGNGLASYACLSRYHFQRLFRRTMGETPGAFRRRLLLERAAYTLGETRQDVTEIAFDAGYESLEGFSRSFRRAFGVSPSHYRRLAPQRFRLPTSNGVHYDPNKLGLQRSTRKGADELDLTDRLIGHDAWLTRRLLERARELTDAQLDAPLPTPQKPLPFESPDSTLRKALDRMVFTKEVWVAAVNGGKIPDNPDNSVHGMLRRLDTAFSEFTEIVRSVRDAGKWDEAFVDELCCPAETFTYGGMIAHVITYSAFRRLTVLKVIESMGITDLGYGDPIEWERTLSPA
jgi:AraC family transcriptional regulator